MNFKPYEKYTDSGVEWIGDIPENWEFSQVNHLCSLGRGRIISNEEIEDNKGIYPVYSSQTKDNGVLGYLNSYDFEGEYVTWTTDGANAGTVFKRKGKFNCTNVCGTLNKKSKKIHLSYLSYYLNFATKKYVRQDINPKLMNNEMAKIKVLLPKLDEQIKISEFLDRKCNQINKVISVKEKQIKIIQEYRQSLITETIAKGLNCATKMKDSGIEWIGEIPEHWKVKKLGYLGKLQNGISKSSDDFGFGYPFVSYSDVYNNIQLPKEVNGLVNSSRSDRNNYSVKKGDIFFTRTSETIEEIGFTSVCLETIENATFAGFLIRFRQNSNELVPDYSKYYFRSNMHRKYFVKEMNLVTRASLSQGLLKKLPVLIPAIEEQMQIADFLDNKCSDIDLLVRKTQQQIEVLEKYRQSLIYEAVTGKIDVRNYKENELEV